MPGLGDGCVAPSCSVSAQLSVIRFQTDWLCCCSTRLLWAHPAPGRLLNKAKLLLQTALFSSLLELRAGLETVFCPNTHLNQLEAQEGRNFLNGRTAVQCSEPPVRGLPPPPAVHICSNSVLLAQLYQWSCCGMLSGVRLQLYKQL